MSIAHATKLTSLCKAASAVLGQQIGVIDALLNRVHAAKAQEVYRAVCPVVGSSMGQHFRHSLDHMECVGLDGLHAVRDADKLVDLFYDRRLRGTPIENDIFEARDRMLFVQDTLDGVGASCEGEGTEKCNDDAQRLLTTHFVLDAESGKEIPLVSTLERELGFAAHHAIHHNTLVRAMAAAGRTGLSMEDLPHNFGRAPGTILHDLEEQNVA